MPRVLERAVWMIVGLGILLTAKGYYDEARRQEGEARVEAATFKREADSLRHAIEDTKRLYTRDTIVLTKRLTEYDTLVVERRISDTVWVEKALAAADSVVRVCRQTVADCGVLVAQKDALIRRLEERLGTVEKKHPSKLGTAVKIGLAFGVGYFIAKH